mmetsp:Transcript_33989/g.105607  ORF Transcript_33989/g.105607 Transcript_33989/m.105607 type:complete len:407 (+) Transcript_33989:114-1334(+)
MVVPLLRGLPGLGGSPASAERRRANSLTNALRSAKDSALRIAEDKSHRSSLAFTNWKAKAQDLATAAASAASSRRSTAAKEEEEQKVRNLCSMGFSPAAARLALRRTGADTALACNWLLEEKNQGAILAAEAKDAYAPEVSPKRPAAAFPNPEEFLELEASADLAEEDDAGAGLGMGAAPSRSPAHHVAAAAAVGEGRDSIASQAMPRCRPAMEAHAGADAEPCEGLLWSSPRPGSSAGVGSSGSCASCQSTARSSAAVRPAVGGGQRPPPAPCTPRGTTSQVPDGVVESPAPTHRGCATEPSHRHRGSVASHLEGDVDSIGETASELSSSVQQADAPPLAGAAKPVEDEEFEVPLPPSSTFWDWPLSRQEKKERLWMLERNLQMMDKKILLRELVQLRVDQRWLR